MAGSSPTEHSASTAPRDRVIDVRTVDEGLWFRVRWDPAGPWFEVIGEDTWVLPIEVDAWREAAHPAVGIGTPKTDPT